MDPERDSPGTREDVDMTAPAELPREEQDATRLGTTSQPSGTPSDSERETRATPSTEKELPHRSTAATSTASPTAEELPPIEEQVKTIETLVKAFAERASEVGDEVYLVSRTWLGRAQAFGGSDAKHAQKESQDDGPPGPVDNADIIESSFTDGLGTQFVKLRPGMGLQDFELFPKDAWDLVVSWYGLASAQYPIVRTAHNTADEATGQSNVQFEFHPPVFVIHRLWSVNSPLPIDQELKQKKPLPPVVATSSSAKFNTFLKDIKGLAGVSLEQKVRVWRVPRLQPAAEASSTAQPSVGINTPPDSPGPASSSPHAGLPASQSAWPEMLLDVATFLQLEKDTQRIVIESPDQTSNPNYNGKLPLNLAGLSESETLVLDEEISRDAYVSTFTGTTKDKALVTRGSSGSLAAGSRATGSGRSSPAPTSGAGSGSGPVTRGRTQQQRNQRTRGCVGLVNMGNTCYMNSALQCVRSVEELTKYFLTKEAYEEINPDNPLSHNGDVARAYGHLLEEFYKQPSPTTITPRQFKTVVGRYASAFSGYGQQDSQEFVGFLLDGLQEDLNRIQKKPYIEKPDSTDDMINNPAAIKEMADKVWDITKKRDDSVIADLFTGMYKSTLICPVCEKVSITFDPFNNLTLPLPVENPWTRTIRYFPLNDVPVEIAVDIDKNSSFKALKQYISERVGVPADRLVGAEEFRDKFFKLYLDDFASVSEEITANDTPAFHELDAVPTNTGGAKKTKKEQHQQQVRSMLNPDEPWEDPRAQRLLVPVRHRLNPQRKENRTIRKSTYGQVPPPHFIVLTPEEARSEDMIRRKVLEKVATFSTHSEFGAEEADPSENTDPELVNASSDVDSGGDGKVVAKSVDSEEDIVDVTMGDASETQKPAVASEMRKEYPRLLKQFKQQRPKWIDPSVYLDSAFQNVFEMSYFRDSGAVVPTGWSNVNEENILPRLSSRLPRPAPSDTEMRSPGAWENSDDGSLNGEDSSPTESHGASSVTRMADESSEEDDLARVKNSAPTRPNGHNFKNNGGGRGGKKKMKAHRTYTKKGKKRLAQQQQRMARQQEEEEDDAEDLDRAADAAESEEPDGGPLLRLGEGLVIDWNEHAYDALFNGDSVDDSKGMRTWTSLQVLEDPEIEVKKKQRVLRRKNGISLDDCLAEFEREEILSEQDTWYCPRCKEHRRASKKFDLWKTPDILVVHLKRFSSSGWRRDKLDILVDFPVEGLDLANRVINTEDGKKEIYDLIGVDDHWGGLGGGHYTAYAKNFVDGEWYSYNDTIVRREEPSKVVTSAAYLLFYRRRSQVPLGGPKFKAIFEKFDQASENPSADEAGEGQRLGKGSSRSGSPSASTGAGLVLPQGSRGLASTPAGSADPELPAYRSTLRPFPDPEDDLAGWTGDQDTLHNSIEDDAQDEGIDLPEYGPSTANLHDAIPRTWDFHNISGNPELEADDAASDVAQNDNSSVEEPFGDREEQAAFEPLASDDFPMDSQPEYQDFDPSGQQATEDLNLMLAQRAWDSNNESRVHNVVPVDVGQDDASDKVAEIHVEDNKAETS